jgi:oligoendopeptidase F
LFRKENIALGVEENRLTNRYFEETGSLTVEWNGVEKTLSEMWLYLEDPDREVRKKAFMMRNEKMLMKENELQAIMSQLVHLRQQKAKYSGLPNYRDYMFKQYERFDYTPDDCKKLAEAIRKHVVPLKKKFQKEHQQELNVKEYRPWDAAAVPKNQQPLKPFNNTEELISGTADILSKIDPGFSKLLKTMNQKGMLDLESRKGKAPGGFCEPLPLSELSVIFMNTSKTQHDVVTLLHEMGHCIHHDLFMDLKLSRYRNVPMESAELASMTMELITMDHWDVFYSDTQELKRAKKDQLALMIDYLPFGVIIDQFQHWMYENPGHSVEERNQVFKDLRETYDSNFIDWSGSEDWSAKEWLGVLHIFELPFYYIEYVIAQLGAIQMYRQYKEDPKQTLINFKKALSLGSSKSLPEVYKAAGIRFDFSEEMVKELMEFVASELDHLE